MPGPGLRNLSMPSNATNAIYGLWSFPVSLVFPNVTRLSWSQAKPNRKCGKWYFVRILEASDSRQQVQCNCSSQYIGQRLICSQVNAWQVEVQALLASILPPSRSSSGCVRVNHQSISTTYAPLWRAPGDLCTVIPMMMKGRILFLKTSEGQHRSGTTIDR